MVEDYSAGYFLSPTGLPLCRFCNNLIPRLRREVQGDRLFCTDKCAVAFAHDAVRQYDSGIDMNRWTGYTGWIKKGSY